MPPISRKLAITWITAVLGYAVSYAVAHKVFHPTPMESALIPGVISAVASILAGYLVKESSRFLSSQAKHRVLGA